LNWAENYQPVIELYQTADLPALSPKSGASEWRVAVAHLFGGFCSTTWKTRQKNPPIDWEVGEGGRYACGLAHFHNGYNFLMNSPNLLDIWPVFFLILSRGFFLCYIRHSFICCPSDSTVPTDAGIKPRTVATGALTVRYSNHTAKISSALG
jgi:hypothetical protein